MTQKKVERIKVVATRLTMYAGECPNPDCNCAFEIEGSNDSYHCELCGYPMDVEIDEDCGH